MRRRLRCPELRGFLRDVDPGDEVDELRAELSRLQVRRKSGVAEQQEEQRTRTKKNEEGRRKKEEGRRKMEDGRRKMEDGGGQGDQRR